MTTARVLENVQYTKCAHFYGWGKVFCTVGKMEADENNDSGEFSDDDVGDNLGEMNLICLR